MLCVASPLQYRTGPNSAVAMPSRCRTKPLQNDTVQRFAGPLPREAGQGCAIA